MVMSCTERFVFFRLPFRIQVFISVNAPYEFRRFEERLAALQPVITTDGIFSFLLQGCQAGRAASALFSALYGSASIRCGEEGFFFSKENGEKRAAAFISREGVRRRPDVSGAG